MKWNIVTFDTLESTNDEAFCHDYLSVVVADRQKNGRGRMGRAWQSLAGNLFCSVVLKPYGLRSCLVGFVASLSLVEALPEFALKLKWPNDVLLEGKKVAGVLLELREEKLVLGVGVNVAQAPTSGLLYEAASLEARVSKAEVLEAFLKRLSYNLELFEKDFENIRVRWLKYAHGLNDEIQVHLPDQQVKGRFIGVDENGALCLNENQQTHRIFAGDVFYL